MIIPWMLYTIVIGALLSAGALMLDIAARALRLPSRYVWVIAIVACLAWPVVAILLPARAPALSAEQTALLPFIAVVQSISSAAGSVIPDHWMRSTNVLVVALWLLTTTALFLRLARNSMRMHTMKATWRRRHVDGTLVRIAPGGAPAVIGTSDVGMEIVVPEWVFGFDPSLRALILRHEDEHRRAFDPMLLMVAAGAVALVPWNPALHWLRRRLTLAIEMDCDSRVLRAHPDVDRYAKLLLAAAQLRSIPRAETALMLTDDSSDLELRILAMNRTFLRRNGLAAGCAILATVLVVMVACDVRDPVSPSAPAEAPATTAELPAPPARGGDQPFFHFEVEKMAAMLPGNREPKYPPQLRAQKIEGQVLIGLVITEEGRMKEGSATVIESSHAAFAEEVLKVLKDYRFRPAEIGGRKVRTHVRLPFDFTLIGG